MKCTLIVMLIPDGAFSTFGFFLELEDAFVFLAARDFLADLFLVVFLVFFTTFFFLVLLDFFLGLVFLGLLFFLVDLFLVGFFFVFLVARLRTLREVRFFAFFFAGMVGNKNLNSNSREKRSERKYKLSKENEKRINEQIW